MIETINYKGKEYPKLQSEGFAAQYIFPFAVKYCKGIGFDIGCNREAWKFDGAIAIDPVINEPYDALNLPIFAMYVDYIFSSHCLEHLQDWVMALDYWATWIRKGGVLFLYLPNCDYQQYWQPQNNRKHLHYLNPVILQRYFNDRGEVWCNVFVTQGYDLNGSFTVIAEKL